jgi:carbohydrate kinase (thermoresistant glucokinase family)
MTGEHEGTARSGRLQVVVMGVSAAGKTTVARALDATTGASFVDADDLHPSENVARMAAGLPLRDVDRWPWLDTVAQELAEAGEAGAVIACSALRRVYRDRIRAQSPRALFVHLAGSRDLLQRRMVGRENHFMPAALLQSQLDTLEALEDSEVGVTVDVGAPVEEIVRTARGWVDAHIT